MTSKYLQVPSWAIQQELSTLSPPSALPTLSSALDLRFLVGLSWLIPTEVGFPVTIPLATGLFLPPLLTRTLQTTYPSLALQPSLRALSGREGLLTLMMTGSCLYSQVLTLKMKFMRSDCFFLHSSSRYLQAPIWLNKYCNLIKYQYLIQAGIGEIFRASQTIGIGYVFSRESQVKRLILRIQIYCGILVLSKISILVINTADMFNEPRSPNIFDRVHLTESKRPTPQGQDPSQNTYYFTKKLESITQFMDFLECNSDNHTELTELQLRWERSFFKEELKASLFLNYTLIKLHCQVNDELKLVKKDLQNRTERKKFSQQFEKKLEWHIQTSENCQAHSNQTPSSKKRVVRDAFEAQRKILQAKHQRQCDELKKMIHKVEDLLRVSKQENQYMRGQLLEISEKNFTLLNDNREAEDCKRKALEENKELRLRIEQLENKSYHETKLNHLNCSPINRSIEAFGQDDAEISFNHQFFNENVIENKLLKKQIEEIQFELDQVKSENTRLQENNNNHQLDQHMDVMQESCRLFLVELEKEYHDVKKQLQTTMVQIGRYQQIIKQIQTKNAENTVKQTEIDRIDAPQKDLCSICSILSKENDTLRAEKKKVQGKYQALRSKFDKTLNLQLIQRQQWDHFLKDLKTE